MADSQNTYQNDVKISGGSSFGFVKIILVLIIAGLLVFFGYNFYTDAVADAYNEGYDEGKEVGRSLGYSKGYSEGYDDAKMEYKEISNSSSNNSNNSTDSSNDFDFSSVKDKELKSSKHDYILNKNTDKFHYSWCHSVDQMKEKNKIYFTGTRSEVINKGYSPCKNCNP